MLPIYSSKWCIVLQNDSYKVKNSLKVIINWNVVWKSHYTDSGSNRYNLFCCLSFRFGYWVKYVFIISVITCWSIGKSWLLGTFIQRSPIRTSGHNRSHCSGRGRRNICRCCAWKQYIVSTISNLVGDTENETMSKKLKIPHSDNKAK